MTATRSSTPTTDAARASAFPLAAAAAARVGTAPAGPGIAWRFPTLPDAVAEAVHTAFGVTIVSDDEAEDPRDLPAFAALYAHARAEQMVRALARRTNLVLPAASALVIGDGPVAEVIAAILSRGGTRVIRGIVDPVVRLRAHLSGVRTTAAPWPAADLVITTGEQDALRLLAPLLAHGPDAGDPQSLPASGVFIDASLDPEPTATAAAAAVRPFVTKTGEHAWHVEAPSVYEAGDGASDRPTRVADALVALSILRADTEDADEADTVLAELVLA